MQSIESNTYTHTRADAYVQHFATNRTTRAHKRCSLSVTATELKSRLLWHSDRKVIALTLALTLNNELNSFEHWTSRSTRTRANQIAHQKQIAHTLSNDSIVLSIQLTNSLFVWLSHTIRRLVATATKHRRLQCRPATVMVKFVTISVLFTFTDRSKFPFYLRFRSLANSLGVSWEGWFGLINAKSNIWQ